MTVACKISNHSNDSIMIYLLWGLLNVGIFLLFIVICFKATKLVREKLGLFASIFFAVGLLSFISQSNSDDDNMEPNSNQIKTWKFNSENTVKSYQSESLNIDLEKTLVSKYYMGIIYGKSLEGDLNIPISAYSSTDGFVSGTNWKPLDIIVNRTIDNKKFEYIVKGVVEWKLLWTTLYSQPKEYKGIALTK